VVGVVVVVVLCFVKSRNGLLVLLWFFFLESNTLTGSLVVLPVLVCASLRSFLSGYHQEEPVTFCCVVDFFCSFRPPRSLSRCADLGGDPELSDRRRSVSFVLLEGEGFVDFAPEVL
jgi:hypothetical protein